MNFYEFLDLNDRGKAFAIWHYGIYLMSRSFNGHNLKLYAIEDFYVEVCYSEHGQLTGQFNCFETVDFLDPYLDEINLDDIESIVRGA